jgi:hypothetical protein
VSYKHLPGLLITEVSKHDSSRAGEGYPTAATFLVSQLDHLYFTPDCIFDWQIFFDLMLLFARGFHNMQNDYYLLAHGQAAAERAELRAQIDKLLVRDGKLEMLIDCLKEFIPVAEPATSGNGHAHEGHEHGHESHEHSQNHGGD